MAVTWKIDNLEYYLSKDKKEKVVYNISYNVFDSKKVDEDFYFGRYSNSTNLDVETIEAVKAKDAVLYTDKDTLLADKAVKVGDIKTPAVEEVKAKDPWANVDFIEYDDLTENVVVEWVKTSLGEDRVKQIEDDIAAQIDAQINPPADTKGNGVPW
tara:strand:- start:30 stop:497 length:468 start_codon:yes stop_codon:yes gene_type:complete